MPAKDPEVVAATDLAFAAEGYLSEDGTRDRVKARSILVSVLAERKVINKSERRSKAIKRGEMVTLIFPSLANPDLFDEQENPAMAEAVWAEVEGYLWGECNPGYNSATQTQVGIVMGNGYVLCRTNKTGIEKLWGSYITDDRACIQDDFITPINDSLTRATARAQHGIELLMTRKPALASQFATGLNRTIKALQSTTQTQLQLALEATTNSFIEDDEDNEDDQE